MEVAIGCGKSDNESILESLYCPFRSIHSMFVRFNKLQLALLFDKGCFYVLGCLVIHDVYLGFEPFQGEVVELFFICVGNEYVLKVSYRCGQNSICFVVVHYKKSRTVIKRDEWE
jgi:hypothetical protein